MTVSSQVCNLELIIYSIYQNYIFVYSFFYEYVSYDVIRESGFGGTVDKTYFYKIVFDSKMKKVKKH